MKNGTIRNEREVFHLDIARYKNKSLIGKILTQALMSAYEYPIHSYIFYLYDKVFYKGPLFITIKSLNLLLYIFLNIELRLWKSN